MSTEIELTLEELEGPDIDRSLVEMDDYDEDEDGLAVQIAYGDRTTDWIDYDDLPSWLQDEVSSTFANYAAADAEADAERRYFSGGGRC